MPSPENDHDIIVEMNANLLTLMKDVSDMKGNIKDTHREIYARIRAVEDISSTNKTNLMNISDDVQSLENKSNIFDGILGVVTVLGTIIGAFLGGKNP